MPGSHTLRHAPACSPASTAPLHPTSSLVLGRVLATLLPPVLMLGLCQAAVADQVLLTNGDRLTGTVLRQAGDQLQIRTTWAGTLTIDWSRVQEVRLDEPEAVLLEDDTLVAVSGIRLDGEQLHLQPAAQRQPMTLPAERVRVIAPEDWETGKGADFSGRVNLAFQDETGNSEGRELDADLTLRYRRRWHEFSSYGQLEYDTARGIKTTDNWLLQNKYTRSFPDTRWYGAYWLDLEHDRFADIRLRYYTGPVVGYRFREGGASRLRAEIGPVYLNEDHYSNTDQDFWGAGLFLDFEQDLLGNALEFYHRNVAYFATTESKDLWTSWTGLRVPLIGGFVSSLEYQLEYDSQPTTKTKSTDETLRLKLGYRW